MFRLWATNREPDPPLASATPFCPLYGYLPHYHWRLDYLEFGLDSLRNDVNLNSGSQDRRPLDYVASLWQAGFTGNFSLIRLYQIDCLYIFCWKCLYNFLSVLSAISNLSEMEKTKKILRQNAKKELTWNYSGLNMN